MLVVIWFCLSLFTFYFFVCFGEPFARRVVKDLNCILLGVKREKDICIGGLYICVLVFFKKKKLSLLLCVSKKKRRRIIIISKYIITLYFIFCVTQFIH